MEKDRTTHLVRSQEASLLGSLVGAVLSVRVWTAITITTLKGCVEVCLGSGLKGRVAPVGVVVVIQTDFTRMSRRMLHDSDQLLKD